MIVRALVDDPDQVSVNTIEGDRSIIFEVRVATEDLGKVIGKNGRIANALRTLVRAAGSKERKSIWVDINKVGEAPASAE
ncbi:MAG: KH domain-containing protein [Armatimonadota bacterium]